MRDARPARAGAGRAKGLLHRVDDELPVVDRDLDVLADVEAGLAEPVAGEAEQRELLLVLPAVGDGADAVAVALGLLG